MIKRIPNLIFDKQALKLWHDAAQEFIEKGFFDKDLDSAYCSMPAIVYEVRGYYQGILAYYKCDNNSFWIQTSYVKPKHRRKGIYIKLRDELTKIAEEEKIKAICSGVYANNEASIKANLAYGNKLSWHHFVQKI